MDEPNPVSVSQAALYERCRVRRSPRANTPWGKAGSASVRQNRVVPAVVATAKSCGCGIGANRRGAGNFRGAREARRNSAPGRARHKPSDHRAGKAVCSATPVCCCAVSLRYTFAQRTVGACRHPAFPAPFICRGRDANSKTRAKSAARSRRRVWCTRVEEMNDQKAVSCPGRCAARSDALQSRGPSHRMQCRFLGPGSAQQRFTLQRVRDTRAQASP